MIYPPKAKITEPKAPTKITLVCDMAPKTGEIYQFFLDGNTFVALITHPEKRYAYVVPYSDDFIIEGPRAEAWANAVRESKGQFVTFIVEPNAKDQPAGALPFRQV
jgi:hypothetical protein